MDDFDSEISGSSCSIPSEPPDIRNWFSSYKYESYVLDTCENFGGIYSEEREIHKDDLVNVEIVIENEDKFDGSGEFGNLNTNENSLHSPSTLSEPPDLRNWFSSYVYESPLLDTSGGFKSYDESRDSECEKEELVNREGIGFRDEVPNSCHCEETISCCKLVKCSTSFVDKKNEPHSHPLFSEPPDIGNWFPDYVYESPVLDLSDEFAVEESKSEDQEDFSRTTEARCRNEVAVSKKLCSNEFGNGQETKSIGKDLHRSGGKENLSLQGNLCPEKILNPSLAVKQVQASSINTDEGVENSCLSSESDRKSTKKLIDVGPPDQSLALVHASECYKRNPIHASNDHKENKVNETVENGFISTRKKRFTKTDDENSPTMPRDILKQWPRNKVKNTTGSELKVDVIKRKVLAETTNVQHCETMEITGKWRCPQKSKPNRGPPLKQLRLDQWVHRV